MMLRLTTYCLVAIVPYVYCEGTLHTSLERYKNDTCGRNLPESDVCNYKVSLSIESYIFRGRKIIKKTNHYTLTDDGFPFSSKQFEIVFPKNLGSLPNPIPIKIIQGSVSMTLFVDNLIDRIFDKTYSFNTDVLKPGRLSQHSDVMRTGFFILKTELRCNPHFNGTGCLQCEIGWFGYRCSVQCTPGSSYTCHPLTGEKVCQAHYYGTDCETYCKPTLDYSTCTESGSVLCLYPARGVKCDKTTACPEHQYGTNCEVTCVSVPGQFTCDEEGERVCDGPFTGPNCTSCQPHHYGPYCNTTCTPRNTTCTPRNTTCTPHVARRYTCSAAGERVCGTGWRGVQCEECADMWFGEGCEVFCNTTSLRFTCTEEGYKRCTGNWGGSECGVCRKYYYGNNCQIYCPASVEGWWRCNKTTGEKMCVSTRRGEDCSQCIKEYYPVKDSAECRKCVETQQYTCTQEGVRSCKLTWYGPDCDVKCEFSEKYSCLSNGSVKCYNNFSGVECETCKANYFGPTCSVYCNETTVSTCDSNGVYHCKKDYYKPPSCTIHCNSSSTTYTCSSTGTKECIGNRNWDRECETCLPHWYGQHCNTFCIIKHRNFACDRNGSLVCREGWTGPNCDECAANWYGDTCDDDGGSGWRGDGGGGRVCVKTCDAFCVDLVHYKCNSEGVLEIRTGERAEDYYDVKLWGIIGGWAAFYLFAVFVLTKTAPLWCPVPEKGK